MIEVIRQDEHHRETRSWLTADWHFSFGSYYDPDNVRFGPLRVLNNDRIRGGAGFPEHSHDNMEIVTWIVRGELVHADSSGDRESRLGRHEIQRMSAGTGMAHSEFNGSDDEELHLLQIWLEPREQDAEPSYEEASFRDEDLRERLVPVASGQGPGGVTVDQDATLYAGLFSPGTNRVHEFEPDRRGYLVVVEGGLLLNDLELDQGDAARVREESRLELEGREAGEVILLDLPG